MKCKNCKNEFTPVRFNQKYCFDSFCVGVWVELEKEYRALRQSAYRLELINLDLKTENNRLTAENNALNYE